VSRPTAFPAVAPVVKPTAADAGSDKAANTHRSATASTAAPAGEDIRLYAV